MRRGSPDDCPMTTWEIPMRRGMPFSLPLLPAAPGAMPQPDWTQLPVCHRCGAGTDPMRRQELTGGVLTIYRFAPKSGWQRYAAACSCATGGARRRCNPGMGWYDDSPLALHGLTAADIAHLGVWLAGSISLEDAAGCITEPTIRDLILAAIRTHQETGWAQDVESLKARAAGGDE